MRGEGRLSAEKEEEKRRLGGGASDRRDEGCGRDRGTKENEVADEEEEELARGRTGPPREDEEEDELEPSTEAGGGVKALARAGSRDESDSDCFGANVSSAGRPALRRAFWYRSFAPSSFLFFVSTSSFAARNLDFANPIREGFTCPPPFPSSSFSFFRAWLSLTSCAAKSLCAASAAKFVAEASSRSTCAGFGR